MNKNNNQNKWAFFYFAAFNRFNPLALIILISSISGCNLNTGFDQDSNLAPVANAGADQRVTQGNTVTLDGGGSFDPERNPLSFRWHIVSQPDGSLSRINTPNDIKVSFAADVPGTFVVQLLVNDGITDSKPDSIKISVIPKPTSSVPQLKFISTPLETTFSSQVYIYDSEAIDQESNTISYSLLVSPENASINAATGEIFWLPTSEGSFRFEILATNNLGESVKQEWSLLVMTNPANDNIKVSVPNISGISLDTATNTLNNIGLKLGKTSWISDATVTKGQVISQNPTAGTVVSKSTTVDLIVSLGTGINAKPTANAGVDMTVAGNLQITLDGSSSLDPDGSITKYSWRQIAGREVTLESHDTSVVKFTSPAVTYDELLIFELTVTDNEAASDTAQVRVTLWVNKSIYLIVDETTKNLLSNELEVFSTDIGTSTSSATKIITTPSTPAELRQILRDGHSNSSLRGAFLIGDVPMVRNQSSRDPSIINLSDHFYRSLYCPFQLTTDPSTVLFEGKESIITSCLPDIWLSRIKGSRLTDSINQIKSYLQKNHQLRSTPEYWQPSLFLMDAQGKDTIPDYKTMVNNVFTQNPLYLPEQVIVSQYSEAPEQKQDFLKALTTPYEILTINIHGATTAISFNGKTTQAMLDFTDLTSIESQPRYIEMYSCSTGAFDTENYLAGELLFNGATQLVQASPTVFGFFSSEYEKVLNRKSRALASGKSPAQLYKYYYEGEPMHYLGDPTISYNNRNTAQQQANMLVASHKFLEPFSYNLQINTDANKTKAISAIEISNIGNTTLILEGKDIADYVTVTPDSILQGTNGFIFTLIENNEPLDFSFQIRIEPGETKSLSIEFNPQAATDTTLHNPGTEFTGVFPISTNDPDAPVFNLEVTGKIN